MQIKFTEKKLVCLESKEVKKTNILCVTQKKHKLRTKYKSRKRLQVWFDIQGGSNMTGTDLCVNLATSVPVIFEPPLIVTCYRDYNIENI